MRKDTSNALIKAIESKKVQETLFDLNAYFHNRKHENQIRDTVLIALNEGSDYKGLSEYPKNKSGAVDLSLYQNGSHAATVEFKHQYPGDLKNKQDVKALVKDCTRSVVELTTHFILIIQKRTVLDSGFICEPKFMDRNDSDWQLYLLDFEKQIGREFHKVTLEYLTQDKILSAYTFLIYQFK